MAEAAAAGKRQPGHREWVRDVKRETKLGLLVTALTVLLFLGALEVGLRLLYPGAPQGLVMPDRELWASLAPNYSTTIANSESITYISTNSLGMRDREVPPKEAGVYRILVNGDSWTFGPGVEIGQTFPKVLEARLNAAFPDRRFEVFNAGVEGYGTDQELLLLRRHIDEIKPDLVLLEFYPGNDVSDNLAGDRFRVEGGKLAANTAYLDNKVGWRMLSYELKKAFYVYGWFSDRLYVAVRVLTEWLGMHPALRLQGFSKQDILLRKSPEYVERGWRLTEALVGEFKKETEVHGARLVVLVLPDVIEYDETRWNELKEKFGLREADFDLEKSSASARTVCERQSLTCLDLLQALRRQNVRQSATLPADGHFNAAGHELVARELAVFLADQNLLG